MIAMMMLQKRDDDSKHCSMPPPDISRYDIYRNKARAISSAVAAGIARRSSLNAARWLPLAE